MNDLDTVVIGAGPGGIATSYYLRRRGLVHSVLERGDVADTWARQRWDSFCLNSNAVLSLMPGDEIQGRNPNEFWRRDRFVGYLQSYAEKSELPIQRHCPAISVDKIDGAFQIETADGFLSCRNVVVASAPCVRVVVAFNEAVKDESKIHSVVQTASG